MGLIHEAYLWEAVVAQPSAIILQEKGGWNELKPLRHNCIALRLKPQRAGFKPIVFDFRPDEGFVLEWVGWENELKFNDGPLCQLVTNKIQARQYFEVPAEDGGKKLTWFNFFYFVRPNGVVAVSNKDYDPMLEKMGGLLNG